MGPGIRSDWGNMNNYQPPAMPSWGSHNYGYGSEGGEQEGVAAHAGPPPPPVPVQEPKKAGRNQAINPKPSAPIDMAAMLAAAQQHMQKSLATKLESIGVPLPGHLRKEAGLTRGVESYDVPDAIPLPGVDLDIAAPSVDMSIADIAPPQEHIPMPPGAGGEYDDIAEPETAENQEYNSQQQQQQQQAAQYQEYQNQQEYYQQEYNQQAYHQGVQESSTPAPPGELAPPGDPAPPGDDDDCRPPGEY